MGTRVARPMPTTLWESSKMTVYTHPIQPKLWLRFIDDIFVVWTEGRPNLEAFIRHLNSCQETIKFTADISSTSANFLDTTVNITESGTLDIDLYSKPTDSHNYLLYTSSHPQHFKNSLPYIQFLRVWRICASVEKFDKHSKSVAHHFSRQGYPDELINEAYILARRQSRYALLTPAPAKNQESQNQNLYVITTFQPDFSGPKEIITKNWDFLTQSNDTKHLHDWIELRKICLCVEIGFEPLSKRGNSG